VWSHQAQQFHDPTANFSCLHLDKIGGKWFNPWILHSWIVRPEWISLHFIHIENYVFSPAWKGKYILYVIPVKYNILAYAGWNRVKIIHGGVGKFWIWLPYKCGSVCSGKENARSCKYITGPHIPSYKIDEIIHRQFLYCNISCVADVKVCCVNLWYNCTYISARLCQYVAMSRCHNFNSLFLLLE
jgi:hypothetical protein